MLALRKAQAGHFLLQHARVQRTVVELKQLPHMLTADEIKPIMQKADRGEFATPEEPGAVYAKYGH